MQKTYRMQQSVQQYRLFKRSSNVQLKVKDRRGSNKNALKNHFSKEITVESESTMALKEIWQDWWRIPEPETLNDLLQIIFQKIQHSNSVSKRLQNKPCNL